MSYIGNTPITPVDYDVQTFPCTVGQTVFGYNYTPGLLDVFLNGIRLDRGLDYVADNGTTIILNVAIVSALDTLTAARVGSYDITDSVKKSGDTLAGKLTTIPSSVSSAGLRLPQGVDPTVPVDGDVWSTASGVKARIAGTTRNLGGANGAGGDAVFFENDQVVTTSYTLSTGKNAISAGPITINTGAEVTIPTGAVWSII